MMNNTNNKIEKMMKLCADMQSFSDIHDELTKLVREYGEAELTVEELDNVSAAVSEPTQSYSRFMQLLLNGDKG